VYQIEKMLQLAMYISNANAKLNLELL